MSDTTLRGWKLAGVSDTDSFKFLDQPFGNGPACVLARRSGKGRADLSPPQEKFPCPDNKTIRTKIALEDRTFEDPASL
jgi:hypothetical protein